MRALLRIALFGIAGPPVGLVVFMLYVGSVGLIAQGATSGFSIPALFEPSNHKLAYLYGGGPALLDVVLAVLIAQRLSGLRLWLAVAAAGAVLSIGATVVFGPVAVIGLGTVVAFALCGFFAGLMCAALFDALAALAQRH